MNGLSRFLKVTLKVCIPVFAAVSLSAQGVNKYIPVSKHVSNDNGITWPYGQVIPHFAMPADTLDALDIQEGISDDEKLMFTVLQGLVNKTHPRLFLFQPAGEGKYKWPEKLGLCMDELPRAKRFELVRKYAAELDGVVLYDPSKNIHYANLASTVAGIENLLPVTQPLHQLLLNEGIKLPVRTDLTRLNFTRTTQIYDYLYKYYWKRCTHRLLVSQPPERGFVRDLAVASGAAIVWLDARKWNENVILRKFLKEMKPGESLVTGWFPEERSGVGMTAEYGLSTIPSDFYMNATVYAGMSQPVHYPKVSKMPELENKIYLALFLSDGDNVQYCQHAMSQLWDKEGRGSIPINWTISPGLVDFGPALLNYYYDTATENDCFASGPSGLGYSLIYDSHNYIWNSDSGEAISPYVKWTQQYLEKSGGSSSVSDISLNLDLPLSTTFRLLKVLQAADFVYQDSQLGWWHIGLGVFNVGAAYIHNRDVLSVAGPFMRRLMLLSGETVNVAIRNGNEAVLIGQLECKSMVRMCAPLGSRLPLHASGAGKALLYPLAEEELMSIILQTGLQQFTPTTLVDMPTLLKDLEQARELGYTVDKEEHVVGLNCIASAIYDDVGSVVAAISISGPSSRLTEDRFVSQGELVRDTARDISTALGLKAHP